MTAIRAVDDKRSKLVVEAGRAPHLDKLAVRRGKVPAVGREYQMINLFLEIEVVKNDAAVQVDKKRATLCGKGEQETFVLIKAVAPSSTDTRIAPFGDSAMQSILLRFSKLSVTVLLLLTHQATEQQGRVGLRARTVRGRKG